MLSTYHDNSMVEKTRQSRAAEGGVENISKLTVIEDYNKFMGGVDLSKYINRDTCKCIVVIDKKKTWKIYRTMGLNKR